MPGGINHWANYSGIPDPRTQCFEAQNISMGMWKGEGTTVESLPFFFRQVALISISIRLLLLLSRFLKQPPFIAEALGGVVAYHVGHMNPTLFFPVQTLGFLEIIARWGLLYYGFFAGQETDVRTLRRPGLLAIITVLIGIPVSFSIAIIGVVSLTDGFNFPAIFVCGAALSMTSAASVTHVLADLRLLNAPISRAAVTSAIVGDAYSWAILAAFIALANARAAQIAVAAVFVVACYFVARAARRRWRRWRFLGSNEEDVTDSQVCWILVGAMVAGVSMDMFGMHSVLGAYVFGLFIPRGSFADILTEKLEHMVIKVLVPLFYCVGGMRAAMAMKTDYVTVWTWAMILAAAGAICRVAIVFAASFWVYQPRHALSLGLIMNAKGLVSLLIINIAWEKSIIDKKMYAIFYFASILMTAAITPLLRLFYRAVNHYALYKHRTIDRPMLDSELRILACLYSMENIRGIANLLRNSHATPHSPLQVFVLHLIELTNRASAMHVVHNTHRFGGLDPANAPKSQLEELVKAFDVFEQENRDTSVQPLTALSTLPSMHVDICSLAEDKRVAFLLLPFLGPHHDDNDGGGSAHADVNLRVLNNAPCSVGVLVDREFGEVPEDGPVNRSVAMLFFFGPDDREALAYAWRMSMMPGITLTVVRFVLEEGANELELLGDIKGDEFEIIAEYEREKRLDNQFVGDFRMRTHGNEAITYSEKVLNSGEDTIAAIKALDLGAYDLYMVGRGEGVVAPLTAGHSEWIECPELGAIGDILVSSDFAPEASVLVVQRYRGVQPNWDERGPVPATVDRSDSWRESIDDEEKATS